MSPSVTNFRRAGDIGDSNIFIVHCLLFTRESEAISALPGALCPPPIKSVTSHHILAECPLPDEHCDYDLHAASNPLSTLITCNGLEAKLPLKFIMHQRQHESEIKPRDRETDVSSTSSTSANPTFDSASNDFYATFNDIYL
jgi:hypothetical protein